MTLRLKKAIFPVAGLGTRFLPATKATPKEMLPIVDKPLIQYAVEEAIAAGFTEIIFITSETKRPIEDHFDSNVELETKLGQQEKSELLEIVRNILPSYLRCAYIRQSQALGLGHAILCAEPFIGNEAFAVILADDLIDAKPKNCLQVMVEIFKETQQSIVAVNLFEKQHAEQYGVVKPTEKIVDQSFFEINAIVEKPKPKDAPSNHGIVGRYILTPEIFHCLNTISPGKNGEYQLTDAIDALIKKERVFAMKIPGNHYDCGDKVCYLEATIAYALQHPTLKNDFKRMLKRWQISIND
ncbi:MAG: UTP--glucose-1-phosphate uridylyltransferase [Gammaproteobacteria bacterium RIFCSPHIGHO2_12_FULL_41_20]|nr:MAG: UTP--glucose-1-phosphate uridylyltransferase [Gammaproteobacteria bacterium RIFCSPHIGHO2_12_FULL_41_20]